MRLLIVLLLGGVLGWIVGSLYPAPHAWLAAVHLDNIQQWLGGAPNEQTTTATTAPTPSSTPTPSTQGSASPSSRGPVDEQTLNQYRAWIHEARVTHPYPDSEDRMYAVMMCESRGQATLVAAAGYSGLFQYSPATWRGAWNAYSNQSILDPRAQIFATALAWHNHMQGQWGCYSHPH
jgi:hypothetical protein